MLIVGGPQTGKSTLLRTLISSLALTHTPREVQFYCLDFGGGGLSARRATCRTSAASPRGWTRSGCAARSPRSHGLLDRREEYFRAQRHRLHRHLPAQARARASSPDEPCGDVFLVIDGWGNFRHEYEDLEPIVTDIAARGLGYGIHVVITAARVHGGPRRRSRTSC